MSRIILLILLTLGCFLTINPNRYNYLHKGNHQQGVITIVAPKLFSSSTFHQWEQIGRLVESGKAYKYIIYIQGYGGDVEIGERFISHIVHAEKAGAIIIFRLTGNVWSMHSLVVCFGTSLEVLNNNTFLMYHGVADDNDFRMKDNSPYKWLFDTCSNRGITPSNTFRDISNGNEVYVYPNTHKVVYKIDQRPTV